MQFTSPKFLFLFLPVAIFLAQLLPRSLRAGGLALSSLFFYSTYATGDGPSWAYCLPIVSFIAINYILGIVLFKSEKRPNRRIVFTLGILFNVGWWSILKSSPAVLADVFPRVDMVLAVGLGFYTLRAISYLMDVYYSRIPALPGFLTFSLYIALFAHLPAGPITPWKWFAGQWAKTDESTDKTNWPAGFYLFCIGLLKKTLADRINLYAAPAIDSGGDLGFTLSWLLLFAYSAQIYFDFSGYTDMALGIGKLIGMELPSNFDRPYRKRNLIEFWNAWHITLSHWLRDVVFSPLGRLLFSVGMLRQSPNLVATICYLTTFLVCGAWHGLQSTFLLWGLYHGIGLSCCKVYGEIARKNFSSSYYHFMFQSRMGRYIAVSTTFLFVSVGWVLFRSQTLGEATNWFRGLCWLSSGVPLWPDPKLAFVLVGTLISCTIVNRFKWDVDHLYYWQKIVLSSGFWFILFYLFISDGPKDVPFIYNLF